jgi:hypothetical protein
MAATGLGAAAGPAITLDGPMTVPWTVRFDLLVHDGDFVAQGAGGGAPCRASKI